MPFDPREVATLVVNGRKFEDWLTVEVKVEVGSAFATFQFSCTEFSPLPSQWGALQFKPGDICDIMFGDVPVLKGYITSRQVAFEGRTHAVQLSGVSKTFDLAGTSIVSQSGSYDGYTFEQIAKALVAPYGIELKAVGQISQEKFVNEHIQPGQLVWSKLVELATQRKIRLAADGTGALIAIGEHNGSTSVDALVEGQNILRARCIISDEMVLSKIYGQGQNVSNDEKWGDAQNKQKVVVNGSATRYRPLIVSSPKPDTIEGLKLLVGMEHAHTEGSKIEAEIIVQGWFSPKGNLWKIMDYPYVLSPMLLIDEPLGIKAVTFRQSSEGGTTTALDMINPAWMNGRPDFSGRPTEVQ